MSNHTTTQEKSTPQPNPPQITDDNKDLIPPNLQNYANLLVGLTVTQQRILYALVANISSENIRTQQEMAVDLGVEESTIWRARQNPQFATALAIITKDAVKGIEDKLILQLMKHGEKNYKAIETILRYCGSLINMSQNVNINASVGSRGGSKAPSLQDTADDLLIRLGELGVDVEYVQDFAHKLPERFLQLKSEGAF